ncbi:hypothetical protein BGZ99_004611 [Dissophora globulifera]|uniref:EngB-type G domain-containing protein n=1 Tax=Dissophora globulifera TaxID=979702 RepID=A0A9P6RTS0_9FUNG|nr:hypothetical protein BGZ99_004611 [Dissophora globulifera]
MLSTGIRLTRRHADLGQLITPTIPLSGCRRSFSISNLSNARLPFFHKRLKKEPTADASPTSLTPTSIPPPAPSAKAVAPTPSSRSPSADLQPELSKRQQFKSITPSSQLMHDIRIQGLGSKAESWSFDKSSRGNKTIRPWDKKLSPEDWKKQQLERRLPPKQVWFEQRTTKVVEKEEVKFPSMRFQAGASSMKSVPSEEALLRMARPDLFDELEEINKLLQGADGEQRSGSDSATDDVQINIDAEEIDKLKQRRKQKEQEIKDSQLQEIAIVGRSNVGKSTMLNTLTESPNTARVSSKPGLTRQLNFYRCGEKFIVVDMPGYGFAFAKEEDKNNWKELIEEYLSTRRTLKRIYVMIDARHGLKVADKEFLAMLDSKSKKFQVVLTKCDLVSPPNLARCYTLVLDELKKTYRHAIAERLLMVSSYTGAGMNNLRKDILFTCGQNILVRNREQPKSTMR